MVLLVVEEILVGEVVMVAVVVSVPRRSDTRLWHTSFGRRGPTEGIARSEWSLVSVLLIERCAAALSIFRLELSAGPEETDDVVSELVAVVVDVVVVVSVPCRLQNMHWANWGV